MDRSQDLLVTHYAFCWSSLATVHTNLHLIYLPVLSLSPLIECDKIKRETRDTCQCCRKLIHFRLIKYSYFSSNKFDFTVIKPIIRCIKIIDAEFEQFGWSFNYHFLIQCKDIIQTEIW